jgi:hypothetical protein
MNNNTPLTEPILKALSTTGRPALTVKQLRDATNLHGHNIYQTLQDLVKKGKVTKKLGKDNLLVYRKASKAK